MSWRASLAIVSLAAGAGVVLAQPGDRPDEQADRETPGEREFDPSPERLAERLSDRLEQLDAMRDRLAGIIGKLEAGEDPEAVLTREDRWWLWRGDRRERWSGDRQFGDRPFGDLFDGPPGGRHDGPEGGPGERRGEGPMGRPGDRDGPSWSGRSRELTDAERAEIRSIIDEHIPMLARRLAAAEEKDPDAAARFFERIAPRFRDLVDLRRDAPELVEVRIDELRTGMAIVGAAREYRRLHAADPESAETASKKDEIRALLATQFDLRQRLEAHRIDQQIADLHAAREELESRASDRDETIDGHLDRVLRRTLDDHDGWRGRRDRDERGGRDTNDTPRDSHDRD